MTPLNAPILLALLLIAAPLIVRVWPWLTDVQEERDGPVSRFVLARMRWVVWW